MSVGDRVRLAIVREASAIKAGNVHPTAAFHDMSFEHFVRAAEAIGEQVDLHAQDSAGVTIEACVDAMIAAAGVNTGLGTILLIVPLAKSIDTGADEVASCNIVKILEELTTADTMSIYEAIRKSKPGGLGESARMDVRSEAPASILEAMRVASAWDDIALQYANGFQEVFRYADRLTALHAVGMNHSDAVRKLQLEILAERPDSLIARKRGHEQAEFVRQQAILVERSGEYGSAEFERAWHHFDQRLRSENHSLNPGTTADLIAAANFVSMCSCELES